MVDKVKKQKRWFVFSLLAVVLLAPGLIMAQSGKIAGTVTDAATGEPLPGANVVVQDTDLGAAAGEDGSYFILNVPPGEYTVSASIIGYATLNKQEVRVKLNQTTTVDYEMQQTAIAGEEVTIVAERPVVERDLTASKETVTAEIFETSWAGSVEEAIRTQSGVNMHGGIRGGFENDVKYRVDGLSIQDLGTGMSYVPLNTTSIQEMEVLTGGFNAEYGQASSGVINVVTKMSQTGTHGSFKARVRPPGVYHWGGNMYSKDRWEWRQTDWNGEPAPNSIEWWQINDGGTDYYQSMTPQQRLEEWRKLLRAEPTLYNYADRWQPELEGTLSGALTANLSFMVSGRYKRGVLEFPSAHKYNPELSGQARLRFDFSDDTRLTINGMYYNTKNSGRYRIPYMASEVIGSSGNPGAYFTSPYNGGKYWPFGSYGYGGGTGLGRVKPPEYLNTYAGSAKLTHVISNRTFLEAEYKYLQNHHESTFAHVERIERMQFAAVNGIPVGDMMASTIFGQMYRPGWFGSEANSWENTVSLDVTSQVHPVHQIKAGAEVSLQYYRYLFWGISGSSFTGGINTNSAYSGYDNAPKNYSYPWEVSAYFQDKVELRGMVVNAGLRLDMFNGNKIVNYDIFDPARLSDYTLGNERGINYIDFDPKRYVEHTPTQVAVSPRIGISHPITETTILHFMYGHFNQRPGWHKIVGNGHILNAGVEDQLGAAEYHSAGPLHGNPWLDFEKVVQYEVGFDQSIANLLRLDATMYYKEGVGLTSMGIQWGGRNDASFGTTNRTEVFLIGDPYGGGEGVGHTGDVRTYTNSGSLESRGLELSLETEFMRNISIRGIYNASFSVTDEYGPQTVWKDFEDVGKLGRDNFYGGSNNDGGTGGNQNERWNPNHQFKLNALINSPATFGPGLGQFHPLGNWTINWYTEWNSGPLYTYYPPGYTGAREPDNKRWFPKTFSNAKLTRYIDIGQNTRFRAFIDVENVFNQKTLQMLGGQDLENYEENGELPKHSVTGEELVWEWYELDLLPRKIYFGLGVEF